MSTKIYDAYSIDIASAKELHSVIKSISNAFCATTLHDECAKLLARSVFNMTQETLFNIRLQCRQRNNKMLAWNGRIITGIKDIITGMHKSKMDAIDNLKHRSIFDAAIKTAQAEIKLYEMDPDISECGFSPVNSIVVFPDNDSVKIMAFGNTLCSFMHMLCCDFSSNSEWQESILGEYKLHDYHYQNSTDKPENISESDWNERAETWSRLLASGIPAKDGFEVIISNSNTANEILSDMYFDENAYADMIKYMPDPDTTAYNKAYIAHLDNYVKTKRRELTAQAALHGEHYSPTASTEINIINEFKMLAESDGTLEHALVKSTEESLLPICMDWSLDEVKEMITAPNGLSPVTLSLMKHREFKKMPWFIRRKKELSYE